MAKKTIITLTCESLGEQQFEVAHAERLLAMPKNGGWHLPDNSKYVIENGSISIRNKKQGRSEE